MYKNNLKVILFPLIIAVVFIGGMFVNNLFTRSSIQGRQEMFLPLKGSKMDMVLNMINHSYVDTVDIQKLEEDAIRGLIKDLDPHTHYIPAKDMQRVNEDITGNFGGIGVQFYKYKDTVTVVKVVPGGPSDKEGVLDGDRIVKVNDSIVAGVKMEDEKIKAMMRGEMGTNVQISIVRRGVKDTLVKTITRGAIPIKSVEVAYMVNDTTGYVKINTFGMNTYEEFMAALEKLHNLGMKKVIIDLRGNEGGILPIALKMVNEFLEDDKLILYAQGKASPRSDYYSNGNGKYKELELTIMIDQSSASASEILAGAIQDNDRGIIVGRRSFGKGLVQEQRILPDGSALRLTVARYYIPSGRSIQRSYDKGKERYYEDWYERIIHGELIEKDSIHFDETQEFQTLGGRTVYGGGGIMPDIFVPIDTTSYSRYFVRIESTRKIYEYTFSFMDQHRNQMKDLKDYKEVINYLNRYNIVEDMVNYVAKEGIPRDEKGIRESYDIIKIRLQAYIARHILDDDGFYPIIGKLDDDLQAAINN